MKRAVFLVAVLFAVSTYAIGQCKEWNLPKDEDSLRQTNERIALYTDNFKAKYYDQAEEPLEWLLQNRPTLHRSIYINGVKIFINLAEQEEDPEKAKYYKKRVAELYDARINICNENGDVYNRKALDLYKLNKSEPEQYANLLTYFKDAIDNNGSKTWVNNLAAYMDIARRYHDAKGLTDDETITVYDQVMLILEESDDKNAEKTSEIVQKMFISTIDMNCDLIGEKFVKKFLDNPEDLSLGRKALGLSTSFECTSSPYFMDLVRAYNKLDPKYGLVKIIGDSYVSEGKFDVAEEFYTEALKLATDQEQLEEVNMKLAGVAFKQGNRSKSREYAQKALEAKPGSKEAYSLIGAIYMTSYEDCRKGIDKVKDRLVFLAAYDKYKMAKDTKGMTSAKEQFPSREELFVQNYQPGDKMTCDCWIGETVTLRTRD